MLFDLLHVQFLLTETKANIKNKFQFLHQNRLYIFESLYILYLTKTPLIEICALVGIMYSCSWCGLNHNDINILFSDNASLSDISVTFPRERANFLSTSLSFINKEECKEAFSTDRYATARPVFEFFNANLLSYFALSLYFTIDKTLYPMRHLMTSRKFNPNKPQKHGLLCKP